MGEKVILGRSATYREEISRMTGGKQTMERQAMLEQLFGWPNTVKDEAKMAADLEENGISANRSAVAKDIKLYAIIQEALEYGQRGRKNFLEEESEPYHNKVPVLGISFQTLLKIVNEIEQSLKEQPVEKAVPVPPLPPKGLQPPEKVKPAKGAGKRGRVGGEPEGKGEKGPPEEIKKLKETVRQQALAIKEHSRDLALVMKDLNKAEEEKKELLRLHGERLEEIDQLKNETTTLRQQIQEQEARWVANVKAFEWAQCIREKLKDVRLFFDELEESLEVSIPDVRMPEEPDDEKLIDVIAQMPNWMKSSGQELKAGPGLAASVELLTNEERQAVLEAFDTFSKVGGSRASFSTAKFGRTTEWSRPGFKLSLISGYRLGFTWQGGKGANPTVIHEIVKLG